MSGLEQIAASLRAEGLRPIIDRGLALVRADCPECHAGASDPFWRPLQIVPRERVTRALCDACGSESHA